MRRRRSWETLREFLRPDAAPNRAIPTMDGGLTPNSALDSFSLRARITEPESVVIADAESVFVSAGNQVLRVQLSTGDVRTVASLKGRALGMAMSPTGLLICVTGHGLLRMAPDGSLATALAPDAVPGAAHLSSVAVHGQDVYCTSASERHAPHDWARDLFAGGHTGRLVRVRDGRPEVLVDGLHWPYGLCASSDGLIFTESWSHSLSTFSPDSGETHTLRDRLPAYPARVTASAKGTFWVAMFAPRNYLVEFILREHDFRDEMVATIAEEEWIRPAMRTSNAVREPLQLGRARHLGEVKAWAPTRSYGLVAEMSAEGEILRSYHSRANGDRHGTTAAVEIGDDLLVLAAGADALLTGNITHAKALA